LTALTRRNLFKLGGLGAGVTAVGLTVPLGESASTSDWISTSAKPARFTRPMYVPQPVTPTPMTDDFGDYLLYEITERSEQAQILDSGAPKTPVLGYSAGSGPVTVPGPLIKVDQNTRVRMRVTNSLPATHPTFGHQTKTSVHLHGSASLPQYDGYADDTTVTGQYKDYWYPNHQGPRTLWYHDHGVHYTAQNAYSGLVAQYHLQNAWEKANLPQGKYDVPLIISDAMFAKDGKLAYMDREHSGLWGDVIMVNGTPWPFHNVEQRFYRFRVLMATLSRSMNLKFVNTSKNNAVLPTYVVGTDGGLMPAQKVTNWRHAGAERYEVMVDFSGCAIGDKIELQNSSNTNNRDFLYTNKVMQFRVIAGADPTVKYWDPMLYKPELHAVMKATRSMSKRTRNIDLEHDDVTNEYMINGKTWHDNQAVNLNLFADDSGDPPKPGDYEIWRIENKSGGWYHPLHIHLVDFQILSRSGGSGKVQPWEKGPKDVVYVGEGEIIEVLVQYAMVPAAYPDGRSTAQAGGRIVTDADGKPVLGADGKKKVEYTGDKGGRYMIHCHNLAHEDHDMMSQFLVAPASGEPDLSLTAPNHPVEAAKPKPVGTY
jgi:FtsP/CotA-like multicopper oxidase with cupredoxin domain